LFCGAGGAGMGYHRAGFDVVGVDILPQPHYPFEFHQGDALLFCGEHSSEFDAIHASPPCQKYCSLKSMPNARHDHPDLVGPTRNLLMKSGRPYVIENVIGSPLMHPTMLCGTMFGLGVKAAAAELRRHRLFETSWFMLNPMTCRHGGSLLTIGVYGDHGSGPNSREKMVRLVMEGKIRRPVNAVQVVGVYGHQGYHPNQKPRRPMTVGVCGNSGGLSIRDGVQQFTTSERAEAMGIDWMTGKEMSQAIPPAYTEYIGKQLLTRLSSIGKWSGAAGDRTQNLGLKT
jgi:DNA (cytosine-5)-methyltransferase 1